MRDFLCRIDRGYHWSWALALGIASVAAMAWSDNGGQSAQDSKKATPPIPCTALCSVKLIEEAVLTFERPGILGDSLGQVVRPVHSPVRADEEQTLHQHDGKRVPV